MFQFKFARPDDRAVAFHGRWGEFFVLQLVNTVLTIVTLGIYRFWAVAKVRRYLWSRSEVVGSPLEWTGTGGEMFRGFLIVVGTLLGVGALIGGAFYLNPVLGAIGMLGFYLLMLWGVGWAQFRALRYRLSRTYWRGIRGGSDDNGVSYGWMCVGRRFIAGLTLGLTTPSMLVENWNDKWNCMSFGPHRFDSYADTDGLMGRWLAIYGAVIGSIALVALAGTQSPVLGVVGVGLMPFVIAAAGMGFMAKFLRTIGGNMHLGDLETSFEVSGWEWAGFYLRCVGMTVITLGLGGLMWRYWTWQFVMDRLALRGTIALDELTQSDTAVLTDAEGFADAFDLGAF